MKSARDLVSVGCWVRGILKLASHQRIVSDVVHIRVTVISTNFTIENKKPDSLLREISSALETISVFGLSKVSLGMIPFRRLTIIYSEYTF